MKWKHYTSKQELPHKLLIFRSVGEDDNEDYYHIIQYDGEDRDFIDYLLGLGNRKWTHYFALPNFEAANIEQSFSKES